MFFSNYDDTLFQMWLGLTDFFLADFPNPIEISSAISACYDQAR
jgi:hypothetical protein